MSKMITVTVIYFELAGNKKFVSGMPSREDGKRLPIYHKDIEQAYQYENEAEAQSFIAKFHNPHERIFKTMSHQVAERRKKLFMRDEEDSIW